MRTLNRKRDDGSILPLVLIIAVVLSVVVLAIAKYSTAGLRYGAVVEGRADRLASADAGIRFGVEQLRLGKSECTTDLGTTGVSTSFPISGPALNSAPTTVTCQRVGTGAGDTEGWAAVVTGGADGTGQFYVHGPDDKTFGGRLFVYDKDEFVRAQGDLTINDGDLWFTDADCGSSVFPADPDLHFTPAGLRGPLCTQATWDDMFTAPPLAVPVAAAATPVASNVGGGVCNVYSPGKYTSSLTLGGENYFRSGEYYFQNATLNVKNGILIAGYADGQYGDTQSFTSTLCTEEQLVDRTDGGKAGVTIYLGGTSKISIDANGQMEIMRREQGTRFVSVQQLETTTSGYQASSLGTSSSIIDVKSGGSTDFSAHGLVWTPQAAVVFGNVANKAQGVALGGMVAATIDVQAPNGAGLVIRTETSPADARLLLTSTATKDDAATSIRAIVQVQPDSGALVLNSWRVCETAGC